MRFLPPVMAIVVIVAAAAPAFADDTLKTATTRGIVLVTGGQDLDIAFTPDGQYTVSSVLDVGTWHIEGDRLCTRSAATDIEDCAVYPAGKMSGDTFVLNTPNGAVTIRLK